MTNIWTPRNRSPTNSFLSQFINMAVPFMFNCEDSSTTFVKNDLLKQPSGNKYYDDEFFHLNILIFHTEQMYKDIVFLH